MTPPSTQPLNPAPQPRPPAVCEHEGGGGEGKEDGMHSTQPAHLLASGRCAAATDGARTSNTAPSP